MLLLSHFIVPLLKNSLLTLKHIVTFSWDDVFIDLTLRLPLILKIGWLPFVQNSWFNWYKLTDSLKMKYLKTFNPVKTMSNIDKNFLCPSFVREMYFTFVTEDKEFRQARLKLSLEQ